MPTPPPPLDPVAAALAYHRRTRHRLPNRFARSLGFLDWDNQPNPFRLYEGCERIPLARVPIDPEDPGPSFDEAYDPARVTAEPVTLASVSRLLYDSLALSAWKQLGSSRWSLRCTPSSGNLHPSEAYLLADLPALGEGPTLSHYSPLVHALERRSKIEPELWASLCGPDLGAEGVFIGLSSIHWREAWKYGERAYRYCQHDIGHAIAALAFAAAGLGWQLRAIPTIDDDTLARLLALPEIDSPESEHPDVLLFAGPRPPSAGPELPASLSLDSEGVANQLSAEHQRWPLIDEVARACTRVGPIELTGQDEGRWSGPEPEASSQRQPLRHLVRTRRSAVALDGQTRLSRAAWLRTLARVMPRPDHVPFASLIGRPRVHLLLFVHRVDEVEPGLYLLVRDPIQTEALKAAMQPGFEWTAIDSGALELPLFRLERADTRKAAAVVSCHQDIAADGAFAVSMLTALGPTLRERGAWMYRQLHWEAGAIGQVLYLEAEAAGRRGTGIGCFFDDGVGQIIGVDDDALCPIYHFTIGGPAEDERLMVLDAYHHLDE